MIGDVLQVAAFGNVRTFISGNAVPTPFFSDSVYLCVLYWFYMDMQIRMLLMRPRTSFAFLNLFS